MNKLLKKPLQWLLEGNAEIILASCLFISTIEFILLYSAAKIEGVVFIQEGVGFLENYGIISTLIGDAFLFYLAKKYINSIILISQNTSLYKNDIIIRKVEEYKSRVCLEDRLQGIYYLFIFIGLTAWIINVSFHVFGDSTQHWGGLVFDSRDHPLGFMFNRINNFYSWIFVLPTCLYVITISSIQFWEIIKEASLLRGIKYDLLNPDKFGGFSFVEKGHIFLNLSIAIIYIQIVSHIITFELLNLEHILSYIFITLAFVFGNSFYMSLLNTKIEEMRIKTLNHYKKKIYNNDALSFDIFKYYQETYSNRSFLSSTNTIVNLMKALSISLPILIKVLEPLFKT